jgi:hypothetical protein
MLCTSSHKRIQAYGQLFEVHFPMFTKQQICQIITDEFGYNPKFVNIYVSSVYDNRSIRSLLTIMQTITPLYDQFTKCVRELRQKNTTTTIANTDIDNMDTLSVTELTKAWKSIQISIKQLLLKTSGDPFLRGSLQHAKTNNQGLSEIQQYLLIAAYLASSTDAKKDNALFGKGGTSVKKGRKAKAYSTGVTKLKKRKEIELIRLLAIMNNLVTNQTAVRIQPMLLRDVLPCVRDLVARQYLLPQGTTSSGKRFKVDMNSTEVNLEKTSFVLSEIIDHEKVLSMSKSCQVELAAYATEEDS